MSYSKCRSCEHDDVITGVCKLISEKCQYKKIMYRNYYGRRKSKDILRDLFGEEVTENDL